MGKHSAPDPVNPNEMPGEISLTPHWQSGSTGGSETHVRPEPTKPRTAKDNQALPTAAELGVGGKHVPRTKAAMLKSQKANNPTSVAGKRKATYAGKHAPGYMPPTPPAPKIPSAPKPPKITTSQRQSASANSNVNAPVGNAFNSSPVVPPPIRARPSFSTRRPSVNRSVGNNDRSRRHNLLRALAVIKATHEGNNKRVLREMVSG